MGEPRFLTEAGLFRCNHGQTPGCHVGKAKLQSSSMNGVLIAALVACATLTAAESAVRDMPTTAELSSFHPHRHELTPKRLEWLANRVSVCGGPWEREFLNETKAIAETKRATRKGDVLRVGPVMFVDDHQETDGNFGPRIEHGSYKYMGVYAGSGLDLVHVQYYEGDGYILVDRKTKTQVEFARLPTPSSSGRFFAAASDSEAYNFHGVQVAERTSNGLRMVVEDDGSKVPAPCGLKWLSENRFEVRVLKGGFDSFCCGWTREEAGRWSVALYRRNNNRWSYQPSK
jgi:hypothetical protein